MVQCALPKEILWDMQMAGVLPFGVKFRGGSTTQRNWSNACPKWRPGAARKRSGTGMIPKGRAPSWPRRSLSRRQVGSAGHPMINLRVERACRTTCFKGPGLADARPGR